MYDTCWLQRKFQIVAHEALQHSAWIFSCSMSFGIALNINHTLRESKQFRNSSEHKEQNKKKQLFATNSKDTKYHIAKWQMYTTSSRSLKSGARFYQAARITSSMGQWCSQSACWASTSLLAIKVATKCNTAGNPSCYGKTGSVINLPLHFLYIKWIKCKPDADVSLLQGSGDSS